MSSESEWQGCRWFDLVVAKDMENDKPCARGSPQVLFLLPAPCALLLHRELECWVLHFPDSLASQVPLRSCQGDWKAGGRGKLLYFWFRQVTVGSRSVGIRRRKILSSYLAGELVVSPAEARPLQLHQNSGCTLRSFG